MSTIPIEQWLNHRPRRGAACVDTIVLHVSGVPDDFDEVLNHLRETEHSFHYVIDRDGGIHKCVPFGAVAFHAGNSYGPHEEARGISPQQDSRHHFVELTSVNEYSLAICLLNRNDGTDSFSKPQIEACRNLVCDLKTPLPKLRWLTTFDRVAPGQAEPIFGLDLEKFASETNLRVWSRSTSPTDNSSASVV